MRTGALVIAVFRASKRCLKRAPSPSNIGAEEISERQGECGKLGNEAPVVPRQAKEAPHIALAGRFWPGSYSLHYFSSPCERPQRPPHALGSIPLPGSFDQILRVEFGDRLNWEDRRVQLCSRLNVMHDRSRDHRLTWLAMPAWHSLRIIRLQNLCAYTRSAAQI